MEVLIYLLQVTACTAVFYLFYYLFLNRLTFFVTNRWYLLITLVISFIIPLLTFRVSQPPVYAGVVEQVVYVYAPHRTIMQQPIPTAVQAQPINWMKLLKLTYLLAVAGLSVHLIITLIAFFKRLKGKRITKIGKVHVLSGSEKIANGSFLNYIFLNEQELSPAEMEQIIAHEMLHVKLYHSVDRILVKIAQIVLWFNPFIYLYARSVEENHEFEVDREVARSTDKHNYANLLLHLSVAGQGMLYHNFSKVPLKKRITMLFNQPSANMKKIVYVLIAPVLLISCLAFARMKKQDARQTQPYSVINDIDKLGKDPLVLIDGKVYKKDILYKISKSCIKGVSISDPDAKMIRNGASIKDGYVEIKTKHGQITYLTDLEQADLTAEHSVPTSQFYGRVHLHKANGTLYDKAIVHVGPQGMVTSEVTPNGKVAFLIDKTLYTEETIKNVSPAIIQSLTGSYGVGPANPAKFPGVDVKGYESVFDFKTDKGTGMQQYRQKIKGVPVDPNSPGHKAFREYANSIDAKVKNQICAEVLHQTITATVKQIIEENIKTTFGGPGGILIEHDGNDLLLKTNDTEKDKNLGKKLKIGDEITFMVRLSAYTKNQPVFVYPAYVVKGNQKIYQSAIVENNNTPFLYEANGVRFADGQISHIEKAAGGTWKSALFVTENGYKFALNFKNTSPTDLNNITNGDHVRLRFVHEAKTGARTYSINDWVAITTNIRDYGVKNPGLFERFYASVKVASVGNEQGKTNDIDSRLKTSDSTFAIGVVTIGYADSTNKGPIGLKMRYPSTALKTHL
jgi:hypothetical protein